VLFNRIISLFVSAVLTFSGFQFLSPDEFIDSFFETVFGIPFTSSSINGDFFNDITENDIEVIGTDFGIVRNRMVIAVEAESSFGEKHDFFKKENLKVIGWCAPVDIYIVKCEQSDNSSIKKECDRLLENDLIKLAKPLTVSRNEPQGTPNDQYYLFDELEESDWDELNPGGSEAWLEMVDARQAWDYEDLFKSVKIGVVDSGFSRNHPELNGKIKFPSFWAKLINYPDYHGTHVAGMIAANRNDGIGVAGLCSHATLVCYDWDTLFTWSTDLSPLFGLVAIVKAGAKVVNFSLGKSASIKDISGKSVNNAIENDATIAYHYMSSLIKKGYDFLCVQSSGNGNNSGDPIDAYYNGIFCGITEDGDYSDISDVPNEEILKRIIVVGSTSYDSVKGYVQSDFSNVGDRVDIVAPGENIISTTTGKTYTYLSGTSMSTPVVTAIAGLIWSVNPDFTSEQVKNIILENNYRISKVNGSLSDESEKIAREIPIANANMCVMEAIYETYSDYGVVSGVVDLKGEKNATVSFNGRSYTVFSNGVFFFVAKSGSGTLKATLSSGEELLSKEITVNSKQLCMVDDSVESVNFLSESGTLELLSK